MTHNLTFMVFALSLSSSTHQDWFGGDLGNWVFVETMIGFQG
jgi:hypothetical protein